jgi:hypothetical protein
MAAANTLVPTDSTAAKRAGDVLAQAAKSVEIKKVADEGKGVNAGEVGKKWDETFNK